MARGSPESLSVIVHLRRSLSQGLRGVLMCALHAVQFRPQIARLDFEPLALGGDAVTHGRRVVARL